jgi:hypothetical protein
MAAAGAAEEDRRLVLAESRVTRRLFSAMLRQIELLPWANREAPADQAGFTNQGDADGNSPWRVAVIGRKRSVRALAVSRDRKFTSSVVRRIRFTRAGC